MIGKEIGQFIFDSKKSLKLIFWNALTSPTAPPPVPCQERAFVRACTCVCAQLCSGVYVCTCARLCVRAYVRARASVSACVSVRVC